VTVGWNQNGPQDALEGELSEEEKKAICEKFDEMGCDFKGMLAFLDPIVTKQLKESAGRHYAKVR